MVALAPLVGMAAGGLAAGIGRAAISLTEAVLIGAGSMAAFAGPAMAFQQGQYNKKVSEQEARARLTAAQINEEKYRRQHEALQGRRRAMTAAAGLEFTGSPLLIALEAETSYERDKAMRLYNAQIGATRAINEGKLAAAAGQAELVTGVLNTGISAFDRFSRFSETTEGGFATASKG